MILSVNGWSQLIYKLELVINSIINKLNNKLKAPTFIKVVRYKT